MSSQAVLRTNGSKNLLSREIYPNNVFRILPPSHEEETAGYMYYAGLVSKGKVSVETVVDISGELCSIAGICIRNYRTFSWLETKIATPFFEESPGERTRKSSRLDVTTTTTTTLECTTHTHTYIHSCPMRMCRALA